MLHLQGGQDIRHVGGIKRTSCVSACTCTLTYLHPMSCPFVLKKMYAITAILIIWAITHSLIWLPSRVADTPPLLPIYRYGYRLFVADVSLCSEVLQPGGSWSSSGSGSM